MMSEKISEIFNKGAASYDEQRAKLAAVKDALHLCMHGVLAGPPPDARVLCVGAGTGAELMSLAQANRGWSFTVVEPAAEMIKVCKQQAEERGIIGRCTFHHGYLDSLPESEEFDAATSILVSHFILDPVERTAYFSEIARRLRPGGYLVNAELAADMGSREYARLLDAWLAMHRKLGIDLNADYLGRDVALVPSVEIQAMLGASGFSGAVVFFQSLLIHAWCSRRAG